jgi:hypothetical protein
MPGGEQRTAVRSPSALPAGSDTGSRSQSLPRTQVHRGGAGLGLHDRAGARSNPRQAPLQHFLRPNDAKNHAANAAAAFTHALDTKAARVGAAASAASLAVMRGSLLRCCTRQLLRSSAADHLRTALPPPPMTHAQELTDEPTWMVDPLDGTTNFWYDAGTHRTALTARCVDRRLLTRGFCRAATRTITPLRPDTSRE